MKRSRRSRLAPGTAGFTLIELLTVIVIIGVLAGLISTAVVKAKKRSLEVARTAELTTIKAAIEAYRFEYQEWPCPEATGANPSGSVTYKNNNYIVIHQWLMDSSAGKNERNVRFLNTGDYRQDASGNLVDYKKNPYEIIMNFDDDTVTVN